LAGFGVEDAMDGDLLGQEELLIAGQVQRIDDIADAGRAGFFDGDGEGVP
jgi:hypothetical protein